MKNSKSILSVFILFLFSIIGASALAQQQPYPVADRQVSVILQRLERNSNKFRNGLNMVLVHGRRVDQTRPENDINTFRPGFERAIAQFRDQFSRHLAGTADVENILENASLINGFMTRNRLNPQVQRDWASVRTELNALGDAYGVSWQWNRQTPPLVNSNQSRLSDSELEQLIQRIDTGGDTFRSSLTDAFGQGHTDLTGTESNMNNAVRNFKNATDQLRNQFDAGQPVAVFVERLLARATPIETYMRANRLTDRVQNDWSTLRGDLDTLGGAYDLSPNSQNAAEPQAGNNSNNRLTGTFRLDPSRSDNPRAIADGATRNLSRNERQEVSDRMLARLESPEMLAIERRGSTITIASSLAQQSTFEADGIERQEQLSNGRWNRVTATLRGDQLGVKSTGYREDDFTVSFVSIEDGRRLRVRREIYADRVSQAVIVNSVYDRTSNAAQWNIYDGSTPVLGDTGTNNGDFLLRDGETVVAVLNNDLTTERAKQGDRFTMNVRQPGQYEGAVIEGTVGSVEQGGRLTGRSGMTLNFDTIRIRNGETYRFAGVLESVRTLNGDTVKIDNEGSAQGDNQTTQTIQRGGIGTAIGAIVGAIAGGAKGAVIGGIIGATAGAGSVYVQGKDNLELPSGTELTIRASAPR